MSKIDKKKLGTQATFLKRGFDLSVSFLGLIITSWLILIAWIIASIETRSNGFFLQDRVGLGGKNFKVIKIKTMYNQNKNGSTVTTLKDPRITRSGAFFRRKKIDELPQLFNVLIGNMSFVGPRPDTPGFADQLGDEDKIILTIRPGITGPATLKYKDEESILANQDDPEKYNRDIIFPDKVKLNKRYIAEHSFFGDLRYLFLTLVG